MFSFSFAQKRRMRQALRAVSPATVRELIEIARTEIATGWSRRTLDQRVQPHAGTYPGRLQATTVRQFIESRPPRERMELTALMLLGRDPLFTTPADFESTCDDEERSSEIAQYLAGKASLADYLEKALALLDL